MQDSLFPEPALVPAPSSSIGPRGKAGASPGIRPAPPDPRHLQVAGRLPPAVRLGTSSWNYPGWTGRVWQDDHTEAMLSRHGLPAYAQHPLLRAVSVDRGFYRPLTVAQYADYAADVPDDFRFVVKAPSAVTDAMVRGEGGRGLQANPAFLDPDLAISSFAAPALEGLGHRLGALVFQLSPLPAHLLAAPEVLLERLAAMLATLPRLRPSAPDAVVAVEVRDPELLGPALARVLRTAGATYCLGLHAKMPSIEEQLPMLRALWPGPMVARWNLNPVNGAYGYDDAKQRYAPFDRIHDPDPQTRAALARVAAATAAAGQPVYITVSNKAEGCAPLSVASLAEDILQVMAPAA